MNDHGPNTICQRKRCRLQMAPHLAGRHLDQRDELYDGPDNLLTVLPMRVRDSARKICRDAPGLTPEVVDMAQEIQRLRDQVAAVRVDAGNQLRVAMARSDSCAVHGDEIRELNRMVTYWEAAQQREEKGRRALLGFLHVIDQFLDGAERGQLREDLTIPALLEAIKAAAKRAHAAHKRAWS